MSAPDEHDHEHDHKDGHGHGHDHEHPILTYADDSVHDVVETDYYPLLTEALRELMLEKGLVKPNDIREHLESFDGADPTLGPRIVARAWTDPAFKRRLLADGRRTIIDDYGIDPSMADLIVTENTDELHNLVVCTLCSCYPRNLLGQPPDWYKSKSYRARAVKEPREVLKEFGVQIGDSVTIHVHDSNADLRYFVLPQRPAGTDGLSEAELAELVTRDCLVGATLPKAP